MTNSKVVNYHKLEHDVITATNDIYMWLQLLKHEDA